MSKRDTTIRDAAFDDVQACAQLIAAHEDADVGSWQRRFEDDFHNPKRSFLVAMSGDEVVGYGHTVMHVHAEDLDDTASPTGYYLSGLLVAPDYRRLGVGTQLTIARLEILRDLTDVAYFVADPENIATIELHACLGFNQLRPVNRNGESRLLFSIAL